MPSSSSSSLRCVNSSTLFTYHFCKEICGELGLYDMTRFLRFLQNANLDRFVDVHRDEISQFLRDLESTSLLEAFHQNFHKTVNMSILI